MDGAVGRADLEIGIEEALIRLAETDREIRAFLPEPGRRDRIRTVSSTILGGPLAGMLVGVKDVIRVNGLDTRAGSALPAEAFAGPQAAVVDRLIAAGALVAGKTVTAEFAVTEPGPTRNPRALSHTPGGSSSGSAAAVAAGMVPLALGTQTVGSIIRPAAFCGVVGFRPTWGSLPLDGVVTNARSLDTVGFFARDVATVALAAHTLCGWEAETPRARQPVLGVPTGHYLDAVDPDARRLFDTQIDRLRDHGYEIRTAPLVDDLTEMRHHLRQFQRFELAQAHQQWFTAYESLYRPATAAAIRDGQNITSAQYLDSGRWRDHFIQAMTRRMTGNAIDLWMTPAAPGAPPRGLSSTGSAVMSAPFSFAGLPALSLPSPDGTLPHGVQFVAARHQDQPLLSSAADLHLSLSMS